METLPRLLSLPALKLTGGELKPHPLTCGSHVVRTPIRRRRISVRAIDGTDLAPVEITWQITIGALAGITPFVIAGIEFSKRIIAQKKCEVCGGSGLVLRDKIYVRCQGCGGFLPWQSWKRFLSG
ncbi:hypothetical protein LUZ60_001568 [Juncus effusus]|nr:hypothetical protein LUZ60_001568 [Juncus effusus]